MKVKTIVFIFTRLRHFESHSFFAARRLFTRLVFQWQLWYQLRATSDKPLRRANSYFVFLQLYTLNRERLPPKELVFLYKYFCTITCISRRRIYSPILHTTTAVAAHVIKPTSRLVVFTPTLPEFPSLTVTRLVFPLNALYRRIYTAS